jgi:hypothetical protein
MKPVPRLDLYVFQNVIELDILRAHSPKKLKNLFLIDDCCLLKSVGLSSS